LKVQGHYQSKVEFANMNLAFQLLLIHINGEHFPLLPLSLITEEKWKKINDNLIGKTIGSLLNFNKETYHSLQTKLYFNVDVQTITITI